MNRRIKSFSDYISEKKKSPYSKATLLKYKRKFEKGEDIPFGIESSLKAQGLIPRADGQYRVSDEYKTGGVLKLNPDTQSPEEIEKEKELKQKERELRKKKTLVKEDSKEIPPIKGEVTFRTEDKDGNEILVREIDHIGACYEPYTHAYIFHDGKISSREDLEGKMNESCYTQLCDYLNDIAINNEVSAQVYMNLPYSQSSSDPMLTINQQR